MVFEEFSKSQALNLDLDLRDRLWWLAMWYAEPNGHATFQPGEIEKILVVRRQDGTTGPPTKRGLNKALLAGKDVQLLHPMSSRECLVLPANAVGNNRGGNQKFKPCAHCMGHTPRPKTEVTLRDYDAEALDRESYRDEMKAQARAVHRERSVPTAGTSSSSRRSGIQNEADEEAKATDVTGTDDMPPADTIEVDHIEWFTERLSNGPVESTLFAADAQAMGFSSSMFPIERFGLVMVDGKICVEDLWNRQLSGAAASAASSRN